MLEGFPVGSQLNAPLEFSELVGEIVGSSVVTRVFHFQSGRVFLTDIAVINIACEIASQQVGQEYTGFDGSTLVHLVCSENREREEGVFDSGLHAASPASGYTFAVVTEDFHAVVLYPCIGFHVFVFEFHAGNDSPFVFRSEPFGNVGFN